MTSHYRRKINYRRKYRTESFNNQIQTSVKNIFWAVERQLKNGLKNLILSVKHGRGSVMDLGLLWHHWQKYELRDIKVLIHELKRNRKQIIKQEHNSKHTSYSTKEWLKLAKKLYVSEVKTYSEWNLWKVLQQTFHAMKPTNIPVLMQFYREEWAKISLSQSEGLTYT